MILPSGLIQATITSSARILKCPKKNWGGKDRRQFAVDGSILHDSRHIPLQDLRESSTIVIY